MKASRVDRWEDIVDALDQSEAKSVVESPARVGEEIWKYLGHPEESKDADRVNVFGHDTWTEDYQGKWDQEKVHD